MLGLGDTVSGQSGFRLLKGYENGHAIHQDRWGFYYVTNESGQITSISDNAINAEVEFRISEFDLTAK